MNSAIASASLLGFGDKPASEALQSFSKTLGKLYESQLKEAKTDEKSRKSVLDEYNKSQRSKKRRESDISEFFKNMRGKIEGQKVAQKEKEKGNNLLGILGIGFLGAMGAGLIGQFIFNGIKDQLMKFVDPIINLINEKLQPIYDFMTGLGDKVGNLVDQGKEAVTDIINDVKEFFGIPVEKEMSYLGDDYKEQELALAAAAEESRSLEGESESNSTGDSGGNTGDSGGNTAWAPVLEMIAGAESNGRYDIMYGGKIIDGITEMTIAQAAKKAGDRGDGKNYAVGKYQFITLVDQAKAAGLNPNKDKFSPKNQDKIAIDLITRKRGVTKQMAKNNPKEAGKRLAMEWAGLPVLAPTKGHKRDVSRGQSYYAGDGVNKSTITPEEVEASFQKLQKGGEVVTPPSGEVSDKKNEGKVGGQSYIKQTKHQLKSLVNPIPRKDNGAPSEAMVSMGGPESMLNTNNTIFLQKGGKVFLHWAGTPHNGSASRRYHATIMRDGTPKQTRDYNTFDGSHTSGFNSQGIGISLDAMGMFNGRWPDFGNFGPFAVKPAQYEGMAKLTADILQSWDKGPEYVTSQNVMTHAEAANIGDQQGKYGPLSPPPNPKDYRWDLWALYENDAKGSGGNKIRNMIRSKMGGKSQQQQEQPEEQSEDTSTTPSPSRSMTPTPTPTTPTPTPTPNSTLRPQGVNPNGPTLDISNGMDELTKQLSGQLLAPLFSLFGIFKGQPFQGESSETTTPSESSQTTTPSGAGGGATPSGAGGGGATSITNPNAKALLNAIADAEGTSQYPEQGYRTMFTGKQFSGDWKHPKQIQSSSGYSSDAAGRYQFLSTTWKEMRMPDFSPANQDQAALKLLSQAGVNISDGLSEQEIYKVGQKWASVEGGPSATKGGSYGAQAKYSATQFMQMYKGYGGEAQKLQQGGTVGQQINRGTMKGSKNIQMTRLREASQKTRKRRGPQIITIPMPPTPAPPVNYSDGGGGGSMPMTSSFTASALADSNRRLAMGATG